MKSRGRFTTCPLCFQPHPIVPLFVEEEETSQSGQGELTLMRLTRIEARCAVSCKCHLEPPFFTHFELIDSQTAISFRKVGHKR